MSYLRIWGLSLMAVLGGTVAINFAVDPYGLNRVLSLDGFNRHKPRAEMQVHLAKVRGVAAARPGALVLGNSRAEIGIDPQHPAWPADARPVYNLAIPGSGVGSAAAHLRHALTVSRPGLVVLGLDFLDFRYAGGGDAAAPSPRLLGNGVPAAERLRRWLADQASTLLSLDALLDSARTVAAQRTPHVGDLRADGFNPLNEYTELVADEGHFGLFRQRDLENLRGYLAGPKTVRAADGTPSPAFAALQEIVALCQREGIALRLFIHPYHGHLLEAFHQAGLWPAFEDWKRELVRTLPADVPLWDFGGYDRVTTEPVPARGDTRTAMRWYWEGGHYKKAAGDLILERVLGAVPADGFGVRLDAGGLEARLAAIRDARPAYRSRVEAELHGLFASQ